MSIPVIVLSETPAPVTDTAATTAAAAAAALPPLLLGPSLGTSSILWDLVAPSLAAERRVLRWDLPGHGLSPAVHEPFSMEELAAGVLAALDAAGIGRIDYAGVSLGGATGLALLLTAPERVERAAILCSGARIGTAESWAERAEQARSQGTGSLVVSSAQRWFAPESMARHPDLSGRLLHSLAEADDESYALCCAALGGFDARSALGTITVPVLALWGAHDRVTPEALAVEIAEGVVDGRAAGVPEAAHLAPAEDPETVVAALREHFARTATAPEGVAS